MTKVLIEIEAYDFGCIQGILEGRDVAETFGPDVEALLARFVAAFEHRIPVAAPVASDGERLVPEVEQLVVTSGLARTGVTTENAGAA